MGKTELLAGGQAEVLEHPADLNKGKYDSLLALADKIDAVVAAQSKIRTALLRVAMPGDFVKFGEKVELTGPGSERIGAAIGMNVSGIRDEKQSWDDKNGSAFTWRYIGNVSVGNRLIEGVEGRASSRDKFFGFENGAWKELADVKEADIRTAARRSLYKEGVKLLLGIRALPADDAYLTSLGLDPKKVKSVKFDSKASGAGADGAKKELRATVKEVGTRTTKNNKTVYVVHFANGDKADTFSKTLAETAKGLAGKAVIAKVKTTNFGLDLESIEADAGTKAPIDEEPPA